MLSATADLHTTARLTDVEMARDNTNRLLNRACQSNTRTRPQESNLQRQCG
jgi:hypothetical protein